MGVTLSSVLSVVLHQLYFFHGHRTGMHLRIATTGCVYRKASVSVVCRGIHGTCNKLGLLVRQSDLRFILIIISCQSLVMCSGQYSRHVLKAQLSFHNVELNVERRFLSGFTVSTFKHHTDWPVHSRSTLKDGVVQWAYISKWVVLQTQNGRRIEWLSKVLLEPNQKSIELSISRKWEQ